MHSNVVYLPGLNGLRAIAAIAVVVSHITQSLDLFHLDPTIFGAFEDGTPKGLDLAGYGVSIFFCLSGFLITYLLQLEKDKSLSIDIKSFYIRRILRIWPLYYLYFSIAVMAILFWGLEINFKAIFFYVFFMSNVPFIFQFNLPFLAHYWSIGVEEQFYLVWPWLNKKRSTEIIRYSIVLILALVGVKLALHIIKPNSIIESIIHISRFHCMMIGAVGALLYKQKHFFFLKIVDNKATQLFSWGVIFLLVINKFHVASVLDNEIISVIALFLIIGQVNVKNRIVNLEIPVFDFLGKISYGIYLIHPLIIFIFSKFIANILVDNQLFKYLLVYFLLTGFTIFMAYLSYEFYEKIFLKYKTKFSIIISSGTKNK